ncbi:unnamed protein product, partial [marine sediment metagenome]
MQTKTIILFLVSILLTISACSGKNQLILTSKSEAHASVKAEAEAETISPSVENQSKRTISTP